MAYVANVTREQALSRGITRYFNGRPCRRGHTGGRYAASGACVECLRINQTDYACKLRTRGGPGLVAVTVMVPVLDVAIVKLLADELCRPILEARAALITSDIEARRREIIGGPELPGQSAPQPRDIPAEPEARRAAIIRGD